MMLLIWEISPESVEAFVVPTGSEAAKLARKSCGHLLGADTPPWSEIEALASWVVSEKSKPFKMTLPIKKHAGITQVVHAGIVL